MSRFAPGRRYVALTLTLAAFGALAAVSMAAHWPMHGGGAGHAGHQPVDPAGAPVAFSYYKDETTAIRTSLLTTAGPLSAQQIVYPTTDGTVHHRGLDDGSPHKTAKVMDEFGLNGVDPDIFGTGRGQVAPVESSSDSKPAAYTFQVFNEDGTLPTDPDIALSIFDQSTGQRISFTRLAGLVNHSVNGSPILFRDAIWFIATPDLPAEPDPSPQPVAKLVKVPIVDPAGLDGNPQVGTPVLNEAAGAQGVSSPTGVWLKDANGEPQSYVAIAFTGGNSVRTFSSENPATAGPASADLGGEAFTPTTPVQADGRMPAAGQPVTTAPYIYVATEETDPLTDYEAGGFAAHKLAQKSDAPMSLVPAEGESNKSPAMPGNPSPTPLSTNQTAAAPATAGGRLVVATSCDVYSINLNDMSDVEALLGPSAPDGCADDDTGTEQNLAGGFGRTTAALSGDLGFIQRNNGQQIAFTIEGAEPLTVPEQFDRLANRDDAPAGPATNAWGQPAISRRLIQFGDDKRLTVYEASASQATPGSAGPAYAIGDASAAEGDFGEKVMTFTVRKFGPFAGSVKVTTQDGSAKAGSDYKPITETVTFTAQESEKSVSVTILSEQVDENDETFYVNLSEPVGTNSSIIDSQGVGVIISDDQRRGGEATPLIAISDVVEREGANTVFTVTMSNSSPNTVTVKFATADDNARAGRDYGAGSGTLTFTPGQTVKPISVPLVADSDKSERVERFFVNLSEPVNAKLADPQGSGFILEKDYDLKRVRPRGFTASTSPKQDTTNPFRFTTSGRLIRPSGLSRALACKGKVSVQIKAVPRKTISTRRVNVRRDCTYRSVVTFTERSRFPESGELEIHARFLGNTVLLPRKARTHKVDTNG